MGLLLARAHAYLQASGRVRDWLAPSGKFGSNAWAISPELSTTGHAMLASDPHGSLSAPATLWPVSIHVIHDLAVPSPSDLHVAGVAFPGVPTIVVGHNAHVAWGAVATHYDVSDVYAETVSDDGSGVRFRGADVPFETIKAEFLKTYPGLMSGQGLAGDFRAEAVAQTMDRSQS